MPRYFFHVRGVEPSTDTEGEDLPDAEATWREATVFAADLLKNMQGRLEPGQEWHLEVTDETGTSIFNIYISAQNGR
jgi:hypothetical protein